MSRGAGGEGGHTRGAGSKQRKTELMTPEPNRRISENQNKTICWLNKNITDQIKVE